MVRGLVVVVCVGCAGVAAAPPPAPTPAPVDAVQHPLAPHAIPGEAMVYEVMFRGLRVGRVQVAVGEPGWVDGHRAIIVKSRGVTDGLLALIGELDWQLETTIDLDRGRPLLTVEDAVITFRGKRETNHDRRTGDTHTIHSAIALLRGWRSSPGQQAELELRLDAMRLGIEIREAGRDLLDKPAVRYEGVARSRYPFQIWISDDTARVPLRMRANTKWGAVAVELVEYTAPRD